MQKAPSLYTGKNPNDHKQCKQHRHHRRHLSCIAISTALALSCTGLFGCSSQNLEDDSGGAKSGKTASDASTADVLIADVAGMDREYTKRDSDPTYDKAESTHIQLNGSTATIENAPGQDGANAYFDNGAVTISSEGTYIVSGKLDDGQLVIDATDADKIQLVLDGTDIHNEDGPAIYIKQVDKCFITLAEGSVNALSDGSEYILEDDSDEPYATLFSKDDLTINGSGTLNVDASYRHGIASKDDLVITGGTVNAKAPEDSLRGRDCVKISNGTFNIESGEDAIKSNNDEDPTRGFVSIDGGTFAITAGDDAIHGEFAVFVEGGQIDIATCYEGLEAQQVYVNGGVVNVTSSDDSINASSPGDSASNGGFDGMDGMDAPRNFSNAGDSGNAGDFSNAGNSNDVGDFGGFEEGAEGMRPPMVDAVEPGMEPSDKAARPERPTMNGESNIDSNMPPKENPGIAEDAPGIAEDVNADEPPDMAQRQRPDQNSDAEPEMRSDKGFGRPQDIDSNERSNLDPDTMPDMGQKKGGFPEEAEEGCLIEINGGEINLTTEGDGIDSNGDFTMNGGTLFVSGPTNGGNGSLDVAGSAAINGGIVLMAGPFAMAQTFTDGTQPSLTAKISGNANDAITIEDSSGEIIISFAPNTQYSFIVASTPSMEAGETYTVKTGQNSLEVQARV